MKSHPRLRYFLVHVLPIVVLLIGLAVCSWQVCVVVRAVAECSQVIGGAAKQFTAGSSEVADFAKITALVERQDALLKQHTDNLRLVLAMAALFCGTLGCLIVEVLHRRAEDDIKRITEEAKTEMSKSLELALREQTQRLNESCDSMVRFLEYEFAYADDHRQRALTTAAAFRLIDLVGVWQQMVCNPTVGSTYREIAIDALGNYKGNNIAAAALAEATKAVMTDGAAPSSTAIVALCVRALGRIGVASAVVRETLDFVSERGGSDPAIISQLETARFTLGI